MAAGTDAAPQTMEFPFASAPDILRTHQKDASITDLLSTQASAIIRSLFGARFAHRHSTTTTHLTELLYLCLTTLLGNRTLGEEYCDVIQVEDETLRLADLVRRIGYISSVVFAPWFLARSLPALRRKLRAKLEHNIDRSTRKIGSKPSTSLRIQEYLLQHLDSLTSLNPIYALSLATFYFTGSYYHISKRLFGLRYIFTRQIKPHEQRVGYEILGVLLVLQMTVQAALHVRETWTGGQNDVAVELGSALRGQPTSAALGHGIEVSIGGSPDHVLADVDVPHYFPKGIAASTQTPILDHSHYDLSDSDVMAWIPQGQQRKCTLCLEPFRDPSVTTCGHVFCWTCVQDWVREKAECPLCRQSVLSQKILPLRE